MSDSAVTPVSVREEWPDADFDIPEGHSIHEGISRQGSEEPEEEDWDLELRSGQAAGSHTSMRAELHNRLNRSIATVLEGEDGEEGSSTAEPDLSQRTIRPPTSEDFEEGFSLPEDLKQLSLAPQLPLSHQSSKNSLEWEDTDHTVSSQSSDAYSTLGLADTLSLTSSTSSWSCPPTDKEDSDDDLDMDGVVLPGSIFDSLRGSRHLTAMLANKRQSISDDAVKIASPDDDLEMGLVIDDDTDFSPARLRIKTQPHIRTQSMPAQRHASTALRSPSRLRHDRNGSSNSNPPRSSARQLQKATVPTTPPRPTRAQTAQGIRRPSYPSPTSATFLPKPGSLRISNSQPVSPPTSPTRKVSRKASMSALDLTAMLSGSEASSSEAGPSKPRYETSTASSRSRSGHRSFGRVMHDWVVPPTRPSTPNTNTAALRLTLPTAGRFKSRPALASIFGPSSPPSSPPRAMSPTPISRPSSRLARLMRPSAAPLLGSPPPRVLRKPKRTCSYGDGTELDDIDDLPTDCEQEKYFRVQPKGYGNRIPGGSYAAKQGTIRRKSSATDLNKRNSFFSAFSGSTSPPPRKRKSTGSPRRKPMLIRNLGGGTQAPKAVGDMKWNPQTMRWEGNDHVLREFDAVVTSTRPALITPFPGSPVSAGFSTSARKVGNMLFDPAKLCWISTLPPEDEEPDVFANFADDEEDGERWQDALQKMSGHARETSECSDTDRGSRASLVCEADPDFVSRCRAAEERHQVEMKGWKTSLPTSHKEEQDRSVLFMIREIANRKL
ncbi:hypothetical protein CYLTODRAFT_486897 [Cylindrobasidium torrendii FP15055 ss-10]|uniref:Protein byr4 n=1 Tax=Cylindrobasidium torrendii FP15055 ss-10 TaxID=1314674 RepID=A0A0D7BQB1_9AGAR|nr:hypothetical protein CYLTODRAFT_486897 [Cylindrobasidium torrendii FP15055 ss-10]